MASIQLGKDATSPKPTHRFSSVATKALMGFFREPNKMILKCVSYSTSTRKVKAKVENNKRTPLSPIYENILYMSSEQNSVGFLFNGWNGKCLKV